MGGDDRQVEQVDDWLSSVISSRWMVGLDSKCRVLNQGMRTHGIVNWLVYGNSVRSSQWFILEF